MHDEHEGKLNIINVFRDRSKDFLLLIAIVIIYIVFTLINPRFASTANIINIARQMSINMIIAVGMTKVIISGGLDLSVGSVGIMSGCLVGVLLINHELPVWLGIVIGLSAGAACGLLNGLCIAKLKVPPFVSTLAMMSIARGIALLLTGGFPISGFPDSFNYIGIGFLFGIPFPVYVMVVIVIIGYILLSKTEFGLNIYALGGNERASRLAGLRVENMKIKIYVISGILAAIGGIMLTARVVSAQPALMMGTNLEVIAAVFVGGTRMGGGEGSIQRTIMGSLLMAFLFNGLNLIGVGFEWQQVTIGVILAGAVAMDMRRVKNII